MVAVTFLHASVVFRGMLLRNRILAPSILPHGHIGIVEIHSPIASTAAGRIVCCQYTTESFSELGIEDRINDRIESRIRVTEPREHLESYARYTSLAEGGDYIDKEEGHPTQQKSTHNHTDRDGRFVVGNVVWRRSLMMDRCH